MVKPNRNRVVGMNSGHQRRQRVRAARGKMRICQAVMETLDQRCMLSGVTTVATPTNWISALPGSIPLTDVSMPGTEQSAAGPSLQNALYGTGSTEIVVPSNPETDAALAAHLAASIAAEASIAADGESTALNATAIGLNTAAGAADIAAGATDPTGSTVLAADGAGVASAIADALLANAAAAADGESDAEAATDNTAADSEDTLAETDHQTAADVSATAEAADELAGSDDEKAGAADATAGGADETAFTDDTLAATDAGLAFAADTAAVSEGGFDPVAEAAGALADGNAAITDGIAVGVDATATTDDTLAEAADEKAVTDEGIAITDDQEAEAAQDNAGDEDAGAAAANTAAATADEAAAGLHTKSALAATAAAAANTTAGTADALTASNFATYINGMSSPDTTGGNPKNSAIQQKLFTLATAEKTAHAAASTAEFLAAPFDTAAALANKKAATADQNAVDAVALATEMNEEAIAANAAAAAEDEKASAADTFAAADNAAAGGADETAGADDATAGALDATEGTDDAAAGIADGVAGGADIAAEGEGELDPIADIFQAASDGTADGLDVTADLDDTAAGTADGIAAGFDQTAVGLDATATAEDETATAEDATAAADDEKAREADEAAAEADQAAAEACAEATTANGLAEAADASADKFDALAIAASISATSADIAFESEVTQLTSIQNSVQTQNLSIGDQLNAGIRSLDLQGSQVNDTINLNAGQYFSGLTLQDSLNDMTSFLQTNPRETIVVSLSANKNQGAMNSSKSFADDLSALLSSSDAAVSGKHTYNDFVYYSSNSSTTPDLNEVRGKIVIIPAGQSWTPAANPATGLQLGWQPTEVDGNSIADVVATDLGNPNTLYRNTLITSGDSSTPIGLGDAANTNSVQYFASQVSRTTGIVQMVDPSSLGAGASGTADPTLINEIINENNVAIVVSSDSDIPGAAGTLRDAINTANAQTGLNTIEFSSNLSGATGQTITLQSNLPVITNDLDIAGPAFIDTNHFQDFQNSPNHTVTEVGSTHSVPVYVGFSGLTEFNLAHQTAPGTIGIYDDTPFSATGTTFGADGITASLNFSYVGTGSTNYPQSLIAPSDAGSYTVTANRIAGDANHTTISSSPIAFTINPAATSTAVVPYANPIVYGQPITYTATVTNINTATVPVGSIQFIVDGTNLGTPVKLNAAGVAVSNDINYESGASHSIEAIFLPSHNFITSNASFTQTVQLMATEPDPSNPALTDIFFGGFGLTTNDHVQISPNGTSLTGSTGVYFNATINGTIITHTYALPSPSIYFYGRNGNDFVQLLPSLKLGLHVVTGNGNDSVTAADGLTTVVLGDGTNSIQLGNGNDTLTLGNGDNTISLGNGADSVTAGKGNNNLQLGTGNNTVTMGDGIDAVQGGDGNNAVTLGNGKDKVHLGNGNNTLTLGNGNDTIGLGNGNNTVTLGDGANVTTIGNGNNSFKAGNGNNNLQLGYGNNSVMMGNGIDNVQSSDGINTPPHTPVGFDIIILGDGKDNVHVGNGNDILTLGNGNDSITAGNGNDQVILGNGNNNLQIGNGSSTVTFGNGNNDAQFGNGNNSVVLGNGTDNLQFGTGLNKIKQGTGKYKIHST